MEREGSFHPLEEMFTEEEQQQSAHEASSDSDTHTEQQPRPSTAETLLIARNPEAKKALREWRIMHKINQVNQGPLSVKHLREFLFWADLNQKIDFSKDQKLKKLYDKYVTQEIERIAEEYSSPEKKKREEVVRRARTRHEEETDESPSVILDTEYAKEIAPAYAYEITTQTLSKILKNKKAAKAYETWTQTNNNPEELKQLDTEQTATEFINWATEHTDIDFSKLLKEKKEASNEKKELTSEQKTILEIRTNKYLQPFVKEWGKLNGANSRLKTISTAEDIINFATWVQTEKVLDIPGETYIKLDRIQSNLENGKNTRTQNKPREIEDSEVILESEDIDEARRRVNTIPETPLSTDTDKIDTEITSYQRKIFDTYGIRLTETGDPATPKDESKIRNMLGLIDPDVRKIQRSGFFGKIKGFFQDIGTSENERMMASAFKKDLSGLTQLILSQPPKYGDRMPVGRSVVRESHTDHIQRGSTTYTRYTPLKRPAPKRPRKPRTTKSQS